LEFDPENLEFVKVRLENPNLLGIEILVQPYDPDLQENYIVAFWRMVESLIGEWLATEAIGLVEPTGNFPDNVTIYNFQDLDKIAREHMISIGAVDPYANLN